MDLLQVAYSPIAIFILHLKSYMSKKISSKLSHHFYWENVCVLILRNTAKNQKLLELVISKRD